MAAPQDYYPWPISIPRSVPPDVAEIPPDITEKVLFHHIPRYDIGAVFCYQAGPRTKKTFTVKSVETSIHAFLTLYHGILVIEKASLILPGIFKGSSEKHPHMIYENILKHWDKC